MKIKIKLDDPDFCNGCPFLEIKYYRNNGNKNETAIHCRLLNELLFRIDIDPSIIRPKECISKHGE